MCCHYTPNAIRQFCIPAGCTGIIWTKPGVQGGQAGIAAGGARALESAAKLARKMGQAAQLAGDAADGKPGSL